MVVHFSTMSTGLIRLAIADDHQMVIDGLKSLLGEDKKMVIVLEGRNGEEIKSGITNHDIDVLLTDIKMPICDGLQLTQWIKTNYKDTKVIALSMFHSTSLIKKMLKAGVDGYILKNTGKEELFMSIYTVLKGQPYFSSDISEKVMRSMMSGQKEDEQSEVLPISLTRRELEILELIVDEHTGPEIAKKLFISINTVETHRKNLLHKLKVKNTAGLVKYALQNQIFN